MSEPDIDKVLTNDGIDLNELHTYIEPLLVIGIRNKDYPPDVPDNVRRYFYPFRKCTKEDFTSRGYNVTELFHKKRIR